MSKGDYDASAAVVAYQALHKTKTINANLDVLLKSQARASKEDEKHFVLETILNGLIEISSTADFISDCAVVAQLAQGTDTAWFSFSLFTMLAPYLTLYSSLMTFKIIDTRRKIDNKEFHCYNYFLSLFLILPTVLFALVLLDAVFMCINFIVYSLMFFILLTPWRRAFHDWYEDIFNKMYECLVGMTVMDV
jgi:hypothetical protein